MEEFIAGVDEVGRGSLVGPVVAAAVILGRVRISELKDSKKLSESKRSEIAQEIKKKAKFVKITKAGFYESMVHSVEMTQKTINYKL